jgi:hypothetical protein
LDPVVSEPQLKALGAAFLWPLYGRPPEGSQYEEILMAPPWGPRAGYHFDVYDDLDAIPIGWLHVGIRKQVPKNKSSNCLNR